MRVLLSSIVVAGCTFLATIPAPAQSKTVELKPSSQWIVDFGPQKCRLARVFGEGEEKHLLAFDQYDPNYGFGLTVTGPSFKRFKSRRNTKLQFAETAEPKVGQPFKGDTGTYGPAMIYSTVSLPKEPGAASTEKGALPQLDLSRAAKVDFVSLAQAGKRVVFKTGPLAKAFEVLNTCTQDMVKDWGLDVEKHLSASQLPEWTNVKKVASEISNLYPTTAINRGEQAIFRMRVIVAADGTVSKCILNKATETKKLQSKACQLVIKKGKFTPGLDAEGNPFESYYATIITYRIGS